jgi:hypothetical protein
MLTRRTFTAGAGLGALSLAYEGRYAMAETEKYLHAVDVEGIARQWPDGRDVPQIVLDVASFVKPKVWPSVGAVRFLGRRMEDFWIESGADLWPDFGVFIVLPDGSRVAQWFREGDSAKPPIVLIGSEGEQEVLAPNLNAFLAGWALARADKDGELKIGTMPVALPYDMRWSDEYHDAPDGRPAFAEFLRGKLQRPLEDFIAAKPDDAPLKAFFDQWGERARRGIAANENLRAMAKLLDKYMPRGEDAWIRTQFQVHAIGDRMEIKKRPPGSPPIAEEAALIPLVRAEREARAQGIHKVRGLWHTAELMLYPDGTCQLASGWDGLGEEPEFVRGGPPTAAEFAEDQKVYPRSPRWIEPWMKVLT